MNKCMLMGRMAKDAELKTTPSGVSVCTFTLAVNRRFKNSEGNYDADFINCVAWRQTAEFICKHFAKGKMIAVAGAIQVRSYDKDGQKRYVTEVVCDEAYFTGEKTENARETHANAQETHESADDTPFEVVGSAFDDSDLPF